MTRYKHEEALRRHLHEALQRTFTQAKATPRSVKEDMADVIMGMDFADAEARVWAGAWGSDRGLIGVQFMSVQEGVTIIYPNGRGTPAPLIDGKTGGLVTFSREERNGAAYGQRNRATQVLRAMERFDDIKVVR